MKHLLPLTLFCALSASAGDLRTVTILHTNDLHARMLPLDNGRGGFAYLATAIRQEREHCTGCLLLNAGDVVQGSPVSTIFHGLPIYEVANLLGFDAGTLGNHDFDYGWRQAQKFASTAKYPIVEANVVDAKGRAFTRKPYVVLRAGGVRVAVLGAMTDDFGVLTTAPLRGEWHTTPLVETVRRYVGEARARADIVIALAHVTEAEEAALLRLSPDLPVIVTGHAHNGMRAPAEEQGRVLVRTKAYAEELGRLELHVNVASKTLGSWTWKRIPIGSKSLGAAPDVAAAVKQWEDKADRIVDEPLAKSEKEFTRGEVRQLIEQAMREETGVDFAFMNAGGVRDILPQGQLLLRHVWNVMPFDNRVVIGTFKGRDLPQAVVRSRAVQPERDYTLAVTDFTAENQAAASQLRTSGLKFPKSGPLLRDLLAEWIRKRGVLK
ncbi:MAG: bifunctional metallophosphatase/5'-nucleotidase [Acidobacteriota bacterium]